MNTAEYIAVVQAVFALVSDAFNERLEAIDERVDTLYERFTSDNWFDSQDYDAVLSERDELEGKLEVALDQVADLQGELAVMQQRLALREDLLEQAVHDAECYRLENQTLWQELNGRT